MTMMTHTLHRFRVTPCVALMVSAGLLAGLLGGCPTEDLTSGVGSVVRPTAIAGEDRTISAGAVTLDGSASRVPAGSTATYAWTQLSGPPIRFRGGSERVLTVTLSEPGVYTFQLTVTDDAGRTDADTVQVTVRGDDGGGDGGGDAVNTPPVANAGADVEVGAGAAIELDGRGSSDADGVIVAYSWVQTAGPVVSLGDASRSAVPITLTQPGVYAFDVTVTDDGGLTATDEVRITVLEAGARMIAEWSAVANHVNLELNWLLPGRVRLEDVNRTGWSATGIESAGRSAGLVTDGLHRLYFRFDGDGRAAAFDYVIDFLGYYFREQDTRQGSFTERVVLDVMNGEPHVVFNSWLAASEPGSGGVSGRHGLESLVMWRNASADVDLVMNAITPTGDDLPRAWESWTRNGFEYATIPSAIALDDGLYRFYVTFHGDSRTADVTFEMAVAGASYRATETMQGPDGRQVAVDVVDGVGEIVFNNWLAADDAWAPELPGRRPIEAMLAWRDASAPVDGVLRVRRVGDAWLPKRRDSWKLSGFELLQYPGPETLADGTYEIYVDLYGDARSATVALRVAILGWTYAYDGVVLGPEGHKLVVEVAGGSVTLVSSTLD